MNGNDDIILISALQKGKSKAFDLVFHKYFQSIYVYLYRHCYSSHDAQDLVQEVFIKLWENRRNIDSEQSLKSYLFTIARNVFVDWTRKSINKQVFSDFLEGHEIVSFSESDIEEKQALDQLLERTHQFANLMPEKRLEVYRLRWVDGLSRKEIAHRMGITVSTVDVHLLKALEYLRKKVVSLCF